MKQSKEAKELKSIWITWHIAQRSRTLAETLDIPIFEKLVTNNPYSRYVLSSIWTIWILIKERPRILFLQLSFLLHLITVLYKLLRFNKVILIADCHTKALRRRAPGAWNRIFQSLKHFSFKHTNITIISNDGLKKDIEKLHHRYLIMPDKLPECRLNKKAQTNNRYCVYSSAFAVDEPFYEIFQVAELLHPDIHLYWTGKKPKHVSALKNTSENLTFTGYLDVEGYWNLIGNANCILALTNEEDCLQCAAYEALSVEVPMVISDTKALRTFFKKSAVYTSHLPERIADSIRFAIENTENLIGEIQALKKRRKREFSETLETLELMLEEEIRSMWK